MAVPGQFRAGRGCVSFAFIHTRPPLSVTISFIQMSKGQVLFRVFPSFPLRATGVLFTSWPRHFPPSLCPETPKYPVFSLNRRSEERFPPSLESPPRCGPLFFPPGGPIVDHFKSTTEDSVPDGPTPLSVLAPFLFPCGRVRLIFFRQHLRALR